MTRRYYSNLAPAVTTTGSMTAAVTSVTVTSLAGFPALFPYVVAVERGTAGEELVLVTNASGATAQITRGYGGTTAKAHAIGVPFEHVVDATDADEANAHVNASGGVHGVSGTLVGATDSQVLTNKTLSSSRGLATSTDPAFKVQATGSGTAALLQGVDAAGTGTTFVFDNTGNLRAPSVTAQTTSAGTIPLVAQGASGQTAKLAVCRDNAGHDLAAYDKEGKLAVTPFVDSATPIINTKNPAAGTTALAFSHQNAAGSTVWSVGSGGAVTATGLTLNSNGSGNKLATASGGMLVDSSDNIRAANMGGRVTRLNSTTVVTSSGSTEVLSTAQTVTLTAGRRYNMRLEVVLGADADDNSVRAFLRAAFGTVTLASTAVVTVTRNISFSGGRGQEGVVGSDDFVAPSTGSYEIAVGVTRRTGAGSGNGQIIAWTAFIDDVGI
jgi:hypothetical protein